MIETLKGTGRLRGPWRAEPVDYDLSRSEGTDDVVGTMTFSDPAGAVHFLETGRGVLELPETGPLGVTLDLAALQDGAIVVRITGQIGAL